MIRTVAPKAARTAARCEYMYQQAAILSHTISEGGKAVPGR